MSTEMPKAFDDNFSPRPKKMDEDVMNEFSAEEQNFSAAVLPNLYKGL